MLELLFHKYSYHDQQKYCTYVGKVNFLEYVYCVKFLGSVAAATIILFLAKFEL